MKFIPSIVQSVIAGTVGFVIAFVVAIAILGPFGKLHADPGLTKCDYSYIKDAGFPEVGKNGNIEYDDDWKKMVEGGWKLKSIGQNGVAVYIFERCR